MKNYLLLLILAIFAFQACQDSAQKPAEEAGNEETEEIVDSLRLEGEKHFKNVRQLTFGGDNAEAYFSFDSKMLSFQAKNPAWGADCDQIYYMPITGYEGDIAPLVSTGKGRTTCAYFMPGDSTIIYASTHEADDNCPPEPAPREDNKYVWPIYDSFDIYVSDLDGNLVTKLTDTPGYDAEPTLSPQGDKIVFTSMRTGDLELFTMDIDGSNVQQVTDGLGYDGGAFFTPDGKKLIFRASRPQTDEEIKTYKDLLAEGLVQPTEMELFMCNVDGSELTQITDLGNANWAPYMHPSGEKIIFCSNHASERGFPFNLYMINVDGSGLEQISFDTAFDAFLVFSPDGKKVAFSSNRNNGGTRATNVFVADWVE
ncbi:MAG: hypothetical protein DWQ02_13745 [Bacteroidetes bacterium]|nr:MAG: hypothetical protein DWQ02_13745 [Bacteroidota bacterium]